MPQLSEDRPARYRVRRDDRRSGSTTTRSLPILDISGLDRGADEPARFLTELRAAARGPGFFYLRGHGIAPDLIRSLRQLSKRFFALPEADKLAIAMVNPPHFRGYNRAGLEHARGKPDWREQIDIGPERQVARTEVNAPAWTRLQGPNQWDAKQRRSGPRAWSPPWPGRSPP